MAYINVPGYWWSQARDKLGNTLEHVDPDYNPCQVPRYVGKNFLFPSKSSLIRLLEGYILPHRPERFLAEHLSDALVDVASPDATSDRAAQAIGPFADLLNESIYYVNKLWSKYPESDFMDRRDRTYELHRARHANWCLDLFYSENVRRLRILDEISPAYHTLEEARSYGGLTGVDKATQINIISMIEKMKYHGGISHRRLSAGFIFYVYWGVRSIFYKNVSFAEYKDFLSDALKYCQRLLDAPNAAEAVRIYNEARIYFSLRVEPLPLLPNPLTFFTCSRNERELSDIVRTHQFTTDPQREKERKPTWAEELRDRYGIRIIPIPPRPTDWNSGYTLSEVIRKQWPEKSRQPVKSTESATSIEGSPASELEAIITSVSDFC